MGKEMYEVIVFSLFGLVFAVHIVFAVTIIYKNFFSKKAAVIRAVMIFSVLCTGLLGMILLKVYEREFGGSSVVSYYSFFFFLISSVLVSYFYIFDTWKLEKKLRRQRR